MKGQSMQFWQYRTTRACVNLASPKKRASIAEFYSNSLDYSVRRLGDRAAFRQQLLEGWWETDKCPYYRIYPSIIPMLLRLNLSIDTGLIKLPSSLRSFAVHFPKIDHKLSFDIGEAHYNIHSLICGPVTLQSGAHIYDGISIWVDFGETLGMCNLSDEPIVKDFPVPTYINMPVEEGLTVEDSSKMLKDDPTATYGIYMPNETKAQIIRLVCTLCLLENDPSIIEPDVLDKDRAKYAKSPDKTIVDRAIRRGKIGWNVGRAIETMPHVRGPSPLALYWTGKGRTIPLIRHRKGCIVHKELITKVSTIEDYDEQQEIEAG
jgi:hypothetical protein